MRNRNVVILVAIATVIRLVLAALVPLIPDETYYWDWSRHLAAGYFDHPPAVAFLVRAGTRLLGDSPVAVRLWSVIAGIVTTFAVAWTASRLAARDEEARAGTLAAMLLLVIPAGLAGFVLATPDAPLLAASALALVAIVRAVEHSRARDALGWWCAAGIATGVALCSKYTAVLIPAAVFIALLSRADLRRRLAEPGPYAAIAVALVIFAPTIAWNASHGWISFAFQLGHGLGASHGSIVARQLSLLGGQLGLVTPILAVCIAIVAVRSVRRDADPRAYVLGVVAIVIALFFVVSATRRPVEPNWPFLAFIAALPLFAAQNSSRRGRSLTWGVALAAFCTLVVVLQAATGVLPIATRRDPLARAHGWDDVAAGVSRVSRPRGCSAVWIAADRYQDASELAFHLPSHPRVFSLNLGGRPNQYDLWPSLYSLAAQEDCAVVVTDSGPGGAAVIARLGAAQSSLSDYAAMKWRGTTIGVRALWVIRGIPSSPPATAAVTTAESAELASLDATFAKRQPLLDSIARLYRGGASPLFVADRGSPDLGNADRRREIAARVDRLHALLIRARAIAVYRDTRYPSCTFVRLGDEPAAEVGYVSAPEGCTPRPSDRQTSGPRLVSRRITDGWYAFVSSRDSSQTVIRNRE